MNQESRIMEKVKERRNNMLMKDRMFDTADDLRFCKKDLVWIGKNPREARRVSGKAGYEKNIQYIVNLIILLESQPPQISWTRRLQIFIAGSWMTENSKEAASIAREFPSQ